MCICCKCLVIRSHETYKPVAQPVIIICPKLSIHIHIQLEFAHIDSDLQTMFLIHDWRLTGSLGCFITHGICFFLLVFRGISNYNTACIFWILPLISFIIAPLIHPPAVHSCHTDLIITLHVADMFSGYMVSVFWIFSWLAVLSHCFIFIESICWTRSGAARRKTFT